MFLNIFFGELIGTMLLILLGNGSVANVLLKRSKGEGSGWIVISAGWGFAVAIAVYASGWASGGHLNPAVTLGMCMLQKTPWNLFPLYFISQMLGAMLGALLVWLAYYPHWNVTKEPHHKLLCFCTQPAVRNKKWNCVTEVIGTAVLLLGVFCILDAHNAVKPGAIPYYIGILIFAIGLSLGGPTGYAINPARDLGPRIIYALLPLGTKTSPDWSYAWVPFFAPLVGGWLGTWVYLSFIAPLFPILGKGI